MLNWMTTSRAPTAPAAGAIEPGHMLAIMGTSTCHVMNSDILADVPGICGVVDGGIVDGSYGYEAGQSAVGDIFAWWTRLTGRDHAALTAAAADQPVGGHGLIALDWMGGNRSILVDHDLSGVIIGLTLATRPEEVYRALLEATAFGTRVIVEAFEAGGLRLTEALLQRDMAAELGHVVIRPADRIGPDADHSALLEGREKGVPISCF